jgi:hypothetical protein
MESNSTDGSYFKEAQKAVLQTFSYFSGSTESNSTEGSDSLASPLNSQQLAVPPSSQPAEQV